MNNLQLPAYPSDIFDEIAKAQAEAILELPEGHTYGKTSSTARFVEAFIEGARWQRTQFSTKAEIKETNK